MKSVWRTVATQRAVFDAKRTSPSQRSPGPLQPFVGARLHNKQVLQSVSETNLLLPREL